MHVVVSLEIVPHSVKQDPYTGDFIDPIFPGGKSSLETHNTIHDDILWIPNYKSNFTSCLNHLSEVGVLYKGKGVDESSLDHKEIAIHIEGQKDKSFHNSCILKYCGKNGIRFADYFPYPTEGIIDWTPVSYNHLFCPQVYVNFDSEIHDHLEEIEIIRPFYQPEISIDGYLCRKIVYVTRCTTNWYFSSSVDKIIHGGKVRKGECDMKVEEYKEGIVDAIKFKPEANKYFGWN